MLKTPSPACLAAWLAGYLVFGRPAEPQLVERSPI